LPWSLGNSGWVIPHYGGKGYVHYHIPDFVVKTYDCFYVVDAEGEEYDTSRFDARIEGWNRRQISSTVGRSS